MPDVVTIAAVLAALVWGLVFMLRGGLMAGCLLYLFAVCCLAHPFFHLDSPPLTIDRAMLGLLLATYVVQRWMGRADPKPFTRADVALLLLTITLIGSWQLADTSGLHPKQVSPFWRLLGGYLTPLAVYWVARQAPLDRRTVALAQGFLVLFGLYLGATALAEITRQWSLVWPRYIADPSVGQHFGRARGPMISSVSFGHYVGVCMLATWIWRSHLSHRGRVLACLSAPLYLAAVFFSYTRSVWIGAVGGLALVLVLTLRGPWRVLVVGSILVAGLLLVGAKSDSLVGFEREQSAADTRNSANVRVSFAYVSWKMFLDRPLFGVGFGMFPDAKMPYLADRSSDLNLEMTRPYVHHNHFLSVLTECGLVGFVLFLATIALWCWNAWRLYRAAGVPEWMQWQAALTLGAVVVWSMQLAFHELSYNPVDNVLMFFLAGITTGLWAQYKRQHAASPAGQPA